MRQGHFLFSLSPFHKITTVACINSPEAARAIIIIIIYEVLIFIFSPQIHSIFRANWHYSKEPLDPFNTFIGLDKLEERGTKAQDVIKVEDLLFQVNQSLPAGFKSS